MPKRRESLQSTKTRTSSIREHGIRKLQISNVTMSFEEQVISLGFR